MTKTPFATLSLALFLFAGQLFGLSGTLPNGLRYVVEELGEGQVQARMHVQVGHLDELPEESGYAHLIEHVVFMREGHFDCDFSHHSLHGEAMKRGIFANAYTSDEETVYELSLQLDGGARMNDALEFFEHMLDDFAFSESMIDHEARVIMEEHRMRKTPAACSRNKVFHGAVFANALYPADHHQQVADATLSATPAGLREFYNGFYNPSRCTLVIVGDIDAVEVEQELKAALSGIENSSEIRQRRLPSKLPKPHAAAVVEDQAAVAPAISLLLLGPGQAWAHSKQEERKQAAFELAGIILNERCKRLGGFERLRPGASHFSAGEYVSGAVVAELQLATRIDSWEAQLQEAVFLMRELAQHWPSLSEFQKACEMKKAHLEALLEAIDQDTEALVQAQLRMLNGAPEYRDPHEQIKVELEALAECDPARVSKAVADCLRSWDHTAILVVPHSEAAPDVSTVEAVASKAWKQAKSPRIWQETQQQARKEAAQLTESLSYAKGWSGEFEAYGDVAVADLDNGIKLGHMSADDSDGENVIMLNLAISEKSAAPITQLALNGMAQELGYLMTLYAEPGTKMNLQASDEGLMLVITYQDTQDTAVRHMLRALFTKTQLLEQDFTDARSTATNEAIHVREQQLAPAAMIAAMESLAGKRLRVSEEQIQAVSFEACEARLQTLLQHSLTGAVFINSKSHSRAMTEGYELFGDLGPAQTYSSIDTVEPIVQEQDIELSIDMDDESAAVLVAYRIDGIEGLQQTVLGQIIASRFHQRVRYDEALVYATIPQVAEVDGVDYVFLSAICRHDNASIVMEQMLEEAEHLGRDGVVFEEIVGLSTLIGVPNWELVQMVEELDQNLSKILTPGPSVSVRVYAGADQVRAA